MTATQSTGIVACRLLRVLLEQLICRWNQLGYVASFITFCGATIFWISTITGVPGVLPAEPMHIAEWDILFWLPQVRPPTTFCTCAHTTMK